MTPPNVIKMIKDALSMSLPKGSEAFLYGSRARGDNRPDSDWDVLIVLDKPRLENSDFERISYPLTLMGIDNGQEINPIIYTKSKWQENSITPFYHNVINDGIRL